ncbi:hypothetical protein MTR67_007143 [Solanum verrucosum]|uniref:Retrotransposon gag protein n=1 Tax=Solanum verrucosum TaxID=315347 RepID=A0AAF0PZM7_SOLVR|nr:hypothetical protein MTR67_007143 [Solanum verrucosum]
MSSTIEKQLASLTKAIEGLAKCAHEQDAKLSKLTNKMDSMIERKSSQAPLKLPKVQDEGESCVKQTKIKEIHIFVEGLIPIDQLKDFIIEAIEDKSESSSKFSPTYVKSYTQRIDNLKMPKGYQPSKLQQFDGKGNPKQHIAHFIETCNDVGTYAREVSLTKACQGEDELVVDFINRWRSLSLNWIKPNTFEELATHAHDMELRMTLREDQQSPVCGPHEDEDIEELQSGGKPASKDDFEESM